MLTENILQLDSDYVWHPYAPANGYNPVYAVESAQGVYLHLKSGEKLIDGMSSWWCVIHGYNHHYLNDALHKQINKMAHVMFGGLTHEPAVLLAERLVKMVPGNMQKVFFSDSGSVSVEVAMKMALQFWSVQGNKNKCSFATIKSGYHGDTWNAMSVCDPVTGMHSLFSLKLPIQYFADAPQIPFDENWDSSDLDSLVKIFETHSNELAGIILEPIVQGAGGMRFYHPEYLKGVKQLCEKYNVLLIADEIATGFGRSGKMFACEWASVNPDIMCIGKALTGGYLSFGATLTNEKIAQKLSSHSPGVFMHGPTFMGNPLACAVANASLDLIEKNNTLQQVKNIESVLKNDLTILRNHKAVAQVRVLGAIGVVEMKEPVNMKSIVPKFVANGIWVRPFGKLVYLMPPYVISTEELKLLIGQLINTINQEYGSC